MLPLNFVNIKSALEVGLVIPKSLINPIDNIIRAPNVCDILILVVYARIFFYLKGSILQMS